MSDSTETHKFEAETGQLLELMISAVYSSKEIFLRELISNASDALDKLRFEALTRPELSADDPEIRLEVDGDARLLKIHDNGIGMSREEVKQNIGVIAKSGTRELLDKIRGMESKDLPPEMIGQFGVGFYSCFMVAERVEIDTMGAGTSESTHWESKGGAEYTISEGRRKKAGTTITLHLRPVDEENGLEDYTKEWILKRIIKDHSDFVRYPIVLNVTREKEVDGEKKSVNEDEVLNSQKAIWLKPKNDVTDEEYTEFYKQLARDWTEPLTHVAMHAEGRIEYRSLLFIPSHAPMDLFYRGYERGLQLYVKNVKILDRCEDLMPEFLRFVKGVVDSPDMPLNLSREMVQYSRFTAQIRSALTKKILDTLKHLMETKRDEYTSFFKELGAVLKEGVASHSESREKIIDILLFESSADDTGLTSLKEYVSRMKEGQTDIYYMAGESRAAIEGSPHLEGAKSRGFEILYMTDPVDEFIMPELREYDGKTLKSVSKGEVDFKAADDAKTVEAPEEETKKSFEPFLKALQKELDEEVSEVKLSARLTTSPACLVGTETSFSPHVERLMAKNKMEIPTQKRILEINPEHDIISKLKARFDVRPTDLALADHAQLLYGQALLAEGSALPNPAKFASLVGKLLGDSL